MKAQNTSEKVVDPNSGCLGCLPLLLTILGMILLFKHHLWLGIALGGSGPVIWIITAPSGRIFKKRLAICLSILCGVIAEINTINPVIKNLLRIFAFVGIGLNLYAEVLDRQN